MEMKGERERERLKRKQGWVLLTEPFFSTSLSSKVIEKTKNKRQVNVNYRMRRKKRTNAFHSTLIPNTKTKQKSKKQAERRGWSTTFLQIHLQPLPSICVHKYHQERDNLKKKKRLLHWLWIWNTKNETRNVYHTQLLLKSSMFRKRKKHSLHWIYFNCQEKRKKGVSKALTDLYYMLECVSFLLPAKVCSVRTSFIKCWEV